MRKLYIILGVILFVVLLCVSIAWYLGLIGSAYGEVWKPMVITQENVAQVISSTNLVQDLPNEASIQLNIGDKNYILRKGSMSEGKIENPDVEISIPESYLEVMGKYGPCVAMANARKNQELSISTGTSASNLAWKYRSLAKYKSCLG